MKISLSVDTKDPNEVAEAVALLNSIGGKGAPTKETPAEKPAETPAAKAPTKKRRTKAEITRDKLVDEGDKAFEAEDFDTALEKFEEAQEVIESEEVAAKIAACEEALEDEDLDGGEDEDEEEDEEVNVDSLRALLQTKVKANRPAIKKELARLEAKNVTSLDPSHYDDFYAFLNAL